MKACPTCGRMYPDDAGFCPVDGSNLVSASAAPIASDDQDARIGNVLCGRYQIRRVVADGGMGRVYEALDLHTKSNVALKVLHPEVAQDEVARERFKREADLGKQLPSEYIADVLDFQPTEDGSWALAMEFLYGEELRATLKREKKLPPERIVRMVSQVALGLEAAHAQKLIHRDLKPDNIFLCQTREGDAVRILDFGSVKDKGDSAKKLTVMGTTIGSPYYMSPEQAQGLDTLDQRADVWALAAITYECLCGEVPFKGSNGPSILLEILTKEPRPPSEVAREKAAQLPPTVDKAISLALKKQASVRISSVGAFADKLGGAFGLDGDHRTWAVATQDELAEQIRENLPRMMEADVSGPSDGAADSFFGEDGALEGFDSAPPPPGPAPAPMAQQFAPGPGGVPAAAPPQPALGYPAPGAHAGEDDLDLAVPKSSAPWIALAAVGALFVVGAIVLVVALVL